MQPTSVHQTLFEVNNARTQSRDEVVKTFVPPNSFWRLLAAKNHVLQGSRGSGKTAVLKMLSHDHLSKSSEPRAEALIQARSFIGVYVPMRAEWVGTLKNKPWMNDRQAESWFQWRLNISTCSAFVDTMESCVAAYVSGVAQRVIAEKRLCVAVSQAWSMGTFTADTFAHLRICLEDVEWERQIYMVRERGQQEALTGEPGAAFSLELFGPLRRGISLLRREIAFPEASVWAVCLDELEFLDEGHHRILNTHMRSSSKNLYFKMATMPYFHHTLKTNTKAPLAHGDDFEYVYLDFDPAFRGTDRQSWLGWAEEVLGAKLSYMGVAVTGFSFSDVFGQKTPLLDEKDQDWTVNSPMMGMMKRFTTPETFNRANALAGTPAFRDQISRKMHGMLLLRDAMAAASGRREHPLYGGPKMVVRCSDANARQLIRIFNSLTFRNPLLETKAERMPIHRPSLLEQTRMMIDYSKEALEVVAYEEGVGDRLAAFITQLCEYFAQRFYDQPLTTDHYFAISVDKNIDEETWALVKYSVGLGLLFPKGRPGSKVVDVLPGKGGIFNLAYRLAPAFGLLPARGRAVDLTTILRAPRRTSRGARRSEAQYELEGLR